MLLQVYIIRYLLPADLFTSGLSDIFTPSITQLSMSHVRALNDDLILKWTNVPCNLTKLRIKGCSVSDFGVSHFITIHGYTLKSVTISLGRRIGVRSLFHVARYAEMLEELIISTDDCLYVLSAFSFLLLENTRLRIFLSCIQF